LADCGETVKLSTISFKIMGIPTLAILAITRQAIAKITRHFHSHRYGSKVFRVAQSLRVDWFAGGLD
jgi:hypothetical protein